MMILIAVVGIAIIAALSVYAWRLTRQVKRIEAEQQAEAAAAEQQLRDYQHSLVQDVRFLARAVLSEQCDITEGVLRLHHTIKGLDPTVWQHENLAVLRMFHEQVADMPILDAYKKLPPKQQFAIDKRRLTLEDEHKAAIEHALKWLVEFRFPGLTLLH
ncbi:MULTISPECIES: DUF2489 domain-containing protein [unclassified Oceanobacter]|uniref:DUF2489 domain-containing protein n=2 Tax=Gammaproteobacteria TaxID=1236 RepID=UPI002734FB81|nr:MULTISPECIES: DUF2489 domain-containing protein [unclassified Oceanobacter]MDP2504752.1 DUF2489 domain-containing protein [Oceanobacter sp. 3_MG-2023]MDP2607497.1 DUF2489 domain-containing protein [Oceanobacter sp. 1_MG-2023]MDP2610765.1 DUF2489 domain-containing protein [Oceanobacter sp. 2_MG-2023]